MLTVFLLLLGIPFEARAQAPELPIENQYELRLESSYFTTSGNFNTGGGSTTGLDENSSFTTSQTQFQALYDLRKNLRLNGGLNWGWSESYDGVFDTARHHSGVSEYFAGVQHWTRMDYLFLAPQADFVFPAFRIDENSDQVLIGEGAMRLRGGSWALLRIQHFRPFIYLGYEYRDEGRSHLVPYHLGIQYNSPKFWAQFDFRGYESLIDDEDSNFRDERDLYHRRVNGGSYHFYAINPAYSEIAMEAGFALGPVNLKTGFALSMNGSSSAEGWTGLVGISYAPNLKREDRVEAEKRFEFKTEKYDQSLFIEDAEPTQPPAKRKIRKKVREKPAVDQLLQDTQRDLEKK